MWTNLCVFYTAGVGLTLGVDLQFFPQEPGSSFQNYNSPLGTKNAK